MKTKLTQAWLLKKLPILNAKEIERRAGMTNGRLADVKRGKVNLSQGELSIIEDILKDLAL